MLRTKDGHNKTRFACREGWKFGQPAVRMRANVDQLHSFTLPSLTRFPLLEARAKHASSVKAGPHLSRFGCCCIITVSFCSRKGGVMSNSAEYRVEGRRVVKSSSRWLVGGSMSRVLRICPK
ncbi:hypothetical protein PoB_007208100 [Plakobranchus ocellatus]|uniref:Uncharacterized protein n=1 Tax=Plakobranchus ocellatus TaxID=259542 RepID=A0AAV4DN53_9GAST|nr:hypothetical protein PoB_007208100 [Plakobranchus ocellatus]